MHFEFIKQLNPSARGELEITDLNKLYLTNNLLNYSIINSWWIDAGTEERIKKLKKLRLSDCIYFKNTNLTGLENLEILSLTPHENHHKKHNDNIIISGFETLKSNFQLFS